MVDAPWGLELGSPVSHPLGAYRSLLSFSGWRSGMSSGEVQASAIIAGNVSPPTHPPTHPPIYPPTLSSEA